ncbi:hypothetical protein Hanom_Chr11g00992591 [Helianthus anomalus]
MFFISHVCVKPMTIELPSSPVQISNHWFNSTLSFQEKRTRNIMLFQLEAATNAICSIRSNTRLLHKPILNTRLVTYISTTSRKTCPNDRARHALLPNHTSTCKPGEDIHFMAIFQIHFYNPRI